MLLHLVVAYKSKPYSILIDDVGCYPQSYAAAATIIRTLQDAPRALIVDIGGFTADYLQVKNGEGDLSIAICSWWYDKERLLPAALYHAQIKFLFKKHYL